MKYWKLINDLLEKHYGCEILIKFNEIEDKIVVYKFDSTWTSKSVGQPCSWSKEDLDGLIECA